MKSEIGECVYVLFYRLWGKTPINGRLRSQIWWKNRLQALIDSPAIEIKTLWETDYSDVPLKYEKEMGLDD